MNSICAECGSQVLDLALHMKIHNDKRSFECEVCGKVVMGKKRILESQTNPQDMELPMMWSPMTPPEKLRIRKLVHSPMNISF